MRWTASRSSERAWHFVPLACAAALALAVPPSARAAAPEPGNNERIDSLKRDLESIRGKEQSVLGELERLDTELRARRAEVDDADAKLGAASAAVEQAAEELARLEARQDERRRYMRFRLREIYKRGPGAPLRLLAGDEAPGEMLRAARYATYLGQKDREFLTSFRVDSERLTEETQGLLEQRKEIAAHRATAEEARAALAASRKERARYLAIIRGDRVRTEAALAELEGASRGLGDLAGSVKAPAAPPAEVQSLRGTLTWPLDGKVKAGFGTTIHPQFKTAVPHPGLDLEAPEGTSIESIGDGTVAWAGSLRGYGLTIIVDHGGGLLSVYAHAAVLLVEQGDAVKQRDVLGKVGDTGSLKGPYLYFELRKDGKPVDPTPWLRRR